MRNSIQFMEAMTWARGAALAAAGILAMGGGVSAQSPAQTKYSSPPEAITALAAAAKSRDRGAIVRILGPKAEQLVSGDDVRDNLGLEAFAALVAEKVAVEPHGDAKSSFVLGEVGWPFPIPVVADGGAWRFDTEAGIDEMISRRIGENELSAIAVCRAYALAQWDYFTNDDWDKDGVAEYAQLLRSNPGLRDGLYWKVVGEDTPSPLAGLVAAGETLGYKVKDAAGAESGPVLGYRFKILTGQGPNAAGGQHGYVMNGNMIAGFGLIAYPVTYGSSGVMTFVINQRGRVYQKDLGPNTAAVAGAATTFNPDPSWSYVADE